ncbi:MAG: hypothetical protein V4480_00210 [Patescibacteria group bacterium]
MFMAFAMGPMLSGCASTQFAGFSSAPLAQVAIVQHPRVNGGVPPLEAVKEITFLSTSCQGQVHHQVAGPGQSFVNGVLPGAISGGSVGPAAHTAFGAAAKTLQYAGYGAIPGAVGGGINNATVGASSAASAIGMCTRDFWDESKKEGLSGDPSVDFKDDKYIGTFVEVVTAGKAWGNSEPRGDEPRPQRRRRHHKGD